MRPYVDMVKQDRHLIGYSTGNFGKNLLLGSVEVTLLFLLTDLLGIAPRNVSLLMAMVFAGDLVLDLGAGLLAAWARNRGIGYRSLIALGALPCAAAYALIYSLPLLGASNIAVIALAIIFFRSAYAIIDVPHNSLLARVATDSRARGRASGYRTVFSSMAGLAIAIVLIPFWESSALHPAPVWLARLGAVGGVLFCGTMLFAAWSSKDESMPGRQKERIVCLPKLDRLYASIAVVALVTGFATPVFGKMILHIATYALTDAGDASRILLILTLGQLAGAGLWIYLIRFRDKSTLLAVSHGVAAAGILLFFLAAEAHPMLLIATTALIGVGFGGVFMLPWGILADIVDFAEFRHGERRETASFAVILVILKAGGAASAAAIGWTLAELGYRPGVPQTAAVIQGMKLLAFGVPSIGALVAIVTLSYFAIGHKEHARVVRANRARRGRVGIS